MIDQHRFGQITHLHDHQGLHASQSAHEVALARRTVAAWLAQDHFRPRTPRPSTSPLDPCKPESVRLLERHPQSAAPGLQRLREPGFAGRYGLGNTDVRTVRPTRHPAFLTLALAPGEWAQVAWGALGTVPVGHTHRRLSCFVMVLGSSRMLSVECTGSQTMAPFLACHPQAFDFFGGLPHQGRVATLTAAVLQRAGGEPPC